jgi:adenosylhomocysteine nucleosidase
VILLCAPTEAELFHLRRAVTAESEAEWAGQRITAGRLAGRPVVAATVGVGKAMSAATAALLCERYRPQLLLLGGIAGGLDPHLPAGSGVIAADMLQWDLDAGGAGVPAGTLPRSRKGGRQPSDIYRTEAELLEHLRRAGEEAASRSDRSALLGRYRTGRLLTGDRLAADPAEKLRLRERFAGAAVDMESAAVALAAEAAGVPCGVLRYIFDAADGSRSGDYREFTDAVSRELLAVMEALAGPGAGDAAPCLSG